MEPSSFPPAVRAGALAMLADGNSVDAVAHVLGVPVAVLDEWRRSGHDVAPATHAPAPRPTAGATRFASTLAYESPRWIRATIGLLCLGMVVFVVASIVPKLLHSHGAPEILRYLLVLALGTIGMAIPYRWTCIRLVFGPTGIRSQGLFGSEALAYGEIVGCTLERDSLSAGRGQRIQGSRLAIRGAGAVPEVSVFIYPGRPLDPEVLDRLNEVCRARGLPALESIPDLDDFGPLWPRVVFIALVVGMFAWALMPLASRSADAGAQGGAGSQAPLRH